MLLSFCICCIIHLHFFLALCALSCYEGTGKLPCGICKVRKNDLCVHQESGETMFDYRKQEDFMKILKSNVSDSEKKKAWQNLSLYPERSALYAIRHPNVHMLFGVDILHMLDVGLSKDLWTLIIRWIHGVPVKRKGRGVDVDGENVTEEARAELVEEAKMDLELRLNMLEGEMDELNEGNLPSVKDPKAKARKGRVGGKQILEKLDARARAIERFPGWKSLIMVSKLPLITGHEMKLIIQMFDLLIDGLIEPVALEPVLQLIMKYNEFYLALTAPSFTEKSLTALALLANEVADLYDKSPLIEYALTDFKTRKFHQVFNHTIDTIRYYGTVLACNTSLWESYHRVIKKIARRNMNAKNQWICEKAAMGDALGTMYVGLQHHVSKKSKSLQFSDEEHDVSFVGMHLSVYPPIIVYMLLSYCICCYHSVNAPIILYMPL